MNSRAKIIIHLGGHDFQPVHEQAAHLQEWLGDACWCHPAESLAAFEHLGECDLLVFLGMYFSGWEGRYRPPGLAHRRAFERYVSSGRAMIFCHGAIASYDDWPSFGELAGFTWPGRRPNFGLAGEYLVRVEPPQVDPITEGIADHVLFDAPPRDVRIAPDVDARIHASIVEATGSTIPMWITGRGGRVAGAGKTAYIAAGHDLRGFTHDSTRQIWINTIRWCLARE